MTEAEWIKHLSREIAAAFDNPDRPYRRPGSALLMTAEWWDLYDRFAALQAQLARQGGRVMIGGGTGWSRRQVLR